MEHLELALETNARHFAARAILAYLRGNADDLKAILDIAPQDGLTRFLLGRLTGEDTLSAYTLGRSEDMTDIALDLAHAGLKAEAEAALRGLHRPRPDAVLPSGPPDRRSAPALQSGLLLSPTGWRTSPPCRRTNGRRSICWAACTMTA